MRQNIDLFCDFSLISDEIFLQWQLGQEALQIILGPDDELKVELIKEFISNDDMNFVSPG